MGMALRRDALNLKWRSMGADISDSLIRAKADSHFTYHSIFGAKADSHSTDHFNFWCPGLEDLKSSVSSVAVSGKTGKNEEIGHF